MPVPIHGKPYKTVAERVSEVHADFQELKIVTDMIFNEGNIVIMRTILKTPKGTFTGIASEDKTNGHINDKSHIEIAETSSVGRALSFAGYHGGEIASANDMNNVGIIGTRTPADTNASPGKVADQTSGSQTFEEEPDLTYDIVLKRIIPCGGSKGKTYKEVYQNDPDEVLKAGKRFGKFPNPTPENAEHLTNLRVMLRHQMQNNNGVLA